MNWRYSGSEQLDPPYYDEDELQHEIDLQEEADEERYEYLKEFAEYD